VSRLYALGVVLGYPTLVAVAVGMAALFVLSLALVLVRPRVAISREVRPDRLTAGEPALGRMAVRNLARWRSPGFVAIDRIDGRPLELTVAGVAGGGRRTLHYPVPTPRRGRLELGPLVVERRDPLGLLRRPRQHAGAAVLWVHPVTYPVRPLPVGRVPDFEGRRADTARAGTVTFSSLREYVPGDDPRRIHWRTTARTGTLTVREHIDTTEPTTTVLLDTRTAALRPETFEYAVQAAASVCEATLRAGRPARAVILGEDTVEVARQGAVSLLDRFAAATRSESDAVALLESVERTPPGGALVVVTGRPDAALTTRLAAQRRRFSPVVVVSLVDRGADLPGYRRPGMTVLAAHTGAEAALAWDQLVAGALR
jgi:uncharacterized protein (DUF58 family)